MDVLVIGGGIGGYVCAIRLAQLGASVTLAERKRLGGTCLNEGCIPTKSLLESAQILEEIQNAEALGVKVSGKVEADFPRMQARKKEVVDQLVKGVGLLMDKGQIRVVETDASLVDGKTALIDGKEEKFDAVVLATGSKPVELPIPGMDLPSVIDSTKALDLEALPQSLAIIGGGVIGMEFASLYRSLGVAVTVIEMMDRIVPPMDPAISEMLYATMVARGVEIHTSARVLSVEEASGLTVHFEKGGEAMQVSAEKVLVATGRTPVSDVLDGARVAVSMDRKFIKVDGKMKTNIDGLYAIGDVTGKSMLAHTAEEQGVRCAEAIMGRKIRPIEYGKIPSCLYTTPEAASVGLTETDAEKQGRAVEVGIFPLFNNARTLIVGQADNTFVKMLADPETKELLGVHIFGPYATEMIGEAALALELECTVQELIDTIHPHPTVSEGLKEGAASVLGAAIHSL